MIEAVVIYLTVAVGSIPCCVRVRYVRLRSSHPHTHPRDVRYDLHRAAVGGLARATAWGPRAVWWVACRLSVWIAVTVIGRRHVTRHLRSARIQMLEAELAADPDPEDLLTQTRALRAALEEYAARAGAPAERVEPVRRRVTEREERLTRMLSA